MPKKIRITRTLVYEGDEEWVRATLAKSYVHLRGEFLTVSGTIRDTSRVEEEIEDDKEGA